MYPNNLALISCHFNTSFTFTFVFYLTRIKDRSNNLDVNGLRYKESEQYKPSKPSTAPLAGDDSFVGAEL